MAFSREDMSLHNKLEVADILQLLNKKKNQQKKQRQSKKPQTTPQYQLPTTKL